MKVKFFLTQAVVEWTVPNPETFNFVVLGRAIKADGYFIADNVFIPYGNILAIGLDRGEGVGFQMTGNAPAPETRQ